MNPVSVVTTFRSAARSPFASVTGLRVLASISLGNGVKEATEIFCPREDNDHKTPANRQRKLCPLKILQAIDTSIFVFLWLPGTHVNNRLFAVAEVNQEKKIALIAVVT